jgi:hypothetical protein
MSEPRPERDEFLVTGQELIDLEKLMARIKQATGRPRAITGGTALRIAHPSGKD